jgi:hypothetical protein
LDAGRTSAVVIPNELDMINKSRKAMVIGAVIVIFKEA